jgi:hypothetical protein
MPSGSTIKVFCPRIHKSNARDVLEEANEFIGFLTNKLVAMACATPAKSGVEVLDELIREVEQVVDELRDASFRSVCANNIIDFPADCEDELDEPTCYECGQVGMHKMSCGSKEAV